MNFLGYFSHDYVDEKGREYYFDNAKFILIVLVVLAHAISQIRSRVVEADMLWTVIYSFHMPCLIMISGYFAKSYISSDRQIKTQKLFYYVLLYTITQIGFTIYDYHITENENIVRSLLHPRNMLWYLLCLVIWFLVIPYIARLKTGIAIIGSVILGLLIGYDAKIGNFFAMSRAISFFPFFIIGYYLKREWFFKYRNVFTQITALIIIAVFFIISYFKLDILTADILMGNLNYYETDVTYFSSMSVIFMNRLIFYCCALVLCACFLLLVPRGKTFFTKLGTRTLAVYILHRFIYVLYTQYDWYLPFRSRKGMLLIMLVAVAITFILSLKPFSIPFDLLAKIKINKFEKPEYSVEK